MTSSSTCSFQFSSASISDTASYTDSLSVDVQASGRFFTARFSASADYQELHESLSSYETVYVSSHAVCEAYVASADGTDLQAYFIDDVINLPAENNSIEYIQFIRRWGTHVADSLRMGGRYGLRAGFSSTKLTNALSSGLDVKAAAGYSGIISLNAEAATSSEKEQARQFEEGRRDFQIYQVGGTPPLNDTSSAFDWSVTVKENPLPLTYHLTPISDFLTEEYFPNHSDILNKQANLLSAIAEYCESLGVAAELCQSDSQPKGPTRFHAVLGNKLTNVGILPGSNDHISFPTLNGNPQYYILGTIYSNYHYSEIHNGTLTDPIVLVDSESAPKEVIRPAISWTHNCTYIKGACAARPKCKTGFSSVSDIMCNIVGPDQPDFDACLLTLPQTMPCVADHCLSECSSNRTYNPYGVLNTIINGNGALGNGPDVAFHRFADHIIDPSKPNITLKSNYKCLSFECVQLDI